MIRTWKNFKLYLLSILLILMFGIVLAQLPKLPELPKDLEEKIPRLDNILKAESPISTSINDAVTEVPFLDDFDPEELIPMNALPRSATGAFKLDRPGLYAFDAQSYCLRAGTYAPTEGDGYLYAPIRGSKADVISNIFQRSYSHPEMPQKDIQVLVWAIIARTKLSDMSQEMQLTAAKLLTPKEIFEINGGALGLIPKSKFNDVFADVPAPLRRVLEAEASIREMLTEGTATYEELEQVAVLHGIPPAEEEYHEVPSGRWSYHPDGYFVRYFVHAYWETEIHLYVPERFVIERDRLGRVTKVADIKGNRIEVEYDDTTTPLTISGDSDVRGYPFRKIHFVQRRIVLPEVVFDLEGTWQNVGWTLVGIPSGKGECHFSQRFADCTERYKWATNRKKELEKLDEQLTPQDGIRDVMDLGHLTVALEKAIDRNAIVWADGHIDLARKAWQYAFTKRQGKYVWGALSPTKSDRLYKPYWLKSLLAYLESLVPFLAYANPGSEEKIPWFNPNEGVGTPGNPGKQREGGSGRPAGSKQDCNKLNSELKQEEALLKAFQDPALAKEAIDNNWSVDDYYDKIKEEALGGTGNTPDDWEAPMETDPSTCEINYNWGGSEAAALQEYIRQFGNVAGPILFRAHQRHEQKHVEQCRTWGPSKFKSVNASVSGFSGTEEEAYKEGIAEKNKGLKGLGCKE